MKNEIQFKLQQLAKKISAFEDSQDLLTLKDQARLLYEKLIVLEALENPEQQLKSNALEESLDSKTFREQNWFEDPKPVPPPSNTNEIVEPAIEKIKDIVAQMPQETQQLEEILEQILPKKQFQKNDLEEFASHYVDEPIFERKEKKHVAEEPKEPQDPKTTIKDSLIAGIPKPKSINEKTNTGLIIGLNDKLAFTKHLFGDSTEDFTRVISQINTFSSFSEAQSFINHKVKPDYNNWIDKEEFTERFLTLVEKRFS